MDLNWDLRVGTITQRAGGGSSIVLARACGFEQVLRLGNGNQQMMFLFIVKLQIDERIELRYRHLNEKSSGRIRK